MKKKSTSNSVRSWVAFAALAIFTTGAQASTILYDWNSAQTVDTGITAAHLDLAVHADSNTVYSIYAKAGALYVREAVSLGDGAYTFADPVQIAAGADKGSIAVDAAGGLHVAYYDSVNQNPMYAHSTDGGSTWNALTLSSHAEDRGQGTAVAIDSAGRIHLLYRGQNGMRTDNPALPMYDLWYTRFAADATGGGTLNLANWDAPLVVPPGNDARKIGDTSVGTDRHNWDLDISGTRVWVVRKMSGDGDANPFGWLMYRAPDAAAGNSFSYVGGQQHLPFFGQLAVDNEDRLWRIYNDRNTAFPRGAYVTPMSATGVKGADQVLEEGMEDYWSFLARRSDIEADINDALHGVYNGSNAPENTTTLKYAFSLGDGTWLSEAVPGGANYGANDMRLAWNSEGFWQGDRNLGEIYILGSSGGNLTLFSRQAYFVPEPTSAMLLGIAGLALLKRQRR